MTSEDSRNSQHVNDSQLTDQGSPHDSSGLSTVARDGREAQEPQPSQLPTSSSSSPSDEDQELNRPNRWQGTSHKYRRLTRDDRRLIDSLAKIENDDLSIHLYNAHAIKRDAYKSEHTDNTSKADLELKSKKQWIEKGKWCPKSPWTAWPLTPDRVPKRNERWGLRQEWYHDPDTRGTAREPMLTSEEMGELLFAEMQRIADQAFRLATAKATGNPAESDESSAAMEIDPQGHDMDAKIEDTNESAREEAAQESDQDLATDEESQLSPTIPSDDEEAEALLKPPINHILASTDRLLKALHRTRVNHQDPDPSDEESASQTSRSRSRATRSLSRRSRKRHSKSGPSGSSAHLPVKPRPPRPMDWSEVLGTAAMLGWDAKAVQRATDRCQSLFGERMEWRTDHQRTSSFPISSSAPKASHQTERSSTADRRRSLTRQALPAATTSLQPGWLCPENRCARATKPFAARNPWLSHIKRVHGYDYEGPELFAAAINTSKQRPEEWLCCTFPSCPRHQVPYPTKWRLNEHMKRAHGIRTASRAPLGARSQSRSRASSGTELEMSSGDEMEGGVHVDGFLKPIRARAGWRGGSVSRSRKRKRSNSSGGMEVSDG